MKAPTKVDKAKGDLSYQMTSCRCSRQAMGCTPGGIQGGGEQWLKLFESADPRD